MSRQMAESSNPSTTASGSSSFEEDDTIGVKNQKQHVSSSLVSSGVPEDSSSAPQRSTACTGDLLEGKYLLEKIISERQGTRERVYAVITESPSNDTLEAKEYDLTGIPPPVRESQRRNMQRLARARNVVACVHHKGRKFLIYGAPLLADHSAETSAKADAAETRVKAGVCLPLPIRVDYLTSNANVELYCQQKRRRRRRKRPSQVQCESEPDSSEETDNSADSDEELDEDIQRAIEMSLDEDIQRAIEMSLEKAPASPEKALMESSPKTSPPDWWGMEEGDTLAYMEEEYDEELQRVIEMSLGLTR